MSNDTPLSILSPYEQRLIHQRQTQIAQVKTKLKSGKYSLEKTTCFCGSTEEIEIITEERMGIPHRLVICRECALIRANPRLTAEGYKQFYNDDYRILHSASSANREVPLRDNWDELASAWVRQVENGKVLLKAYEEQGQTFPKTVLDFGCYYGGMMQAFHDRGVKCYGIEVDHTAREIAEERGFDISSSLDDLITRGVKVDFIIMQDIIEHLTDLRGDLEKIDKLLEKGGILYIWTPGLFGSTVTTNNLFQFAHTFQFCGHTLDYVMGALGFEPIYLDEMCTSFWRRPVSYSSQNFYVPRKPTEWVEFSLDQLDKKKNRRFPPCKNICKFTRKERYENIELNCKKGIPDLQALTNKYSGSLMVVGGGPSVNEQLGLMKKMHSDGMPVIAIARMYPFCVENGLGPDFVVSMDSMEEQEKGFEKINPDTIYLMCSVTRPSLFDKLPEGKAYLWDNMDEVKVRQIRERAGYKVATMVNGGGSVTVSTMSLGMNLGFSDFHVFGADCMFTDKNQTHAKGIAGENVQAVVEEVDIENKFYLTTSSFVMFAKHFLDMIWVGYSSGLLKTVKFYGESLINKMWSGKFLTPEEMEALMDKEKEKLKDE